MGRCANMLDWVPARVVLCVLLFFGFMVTFLLRVNLNLAVVAMVKHPVPNDTNSTSGELVEQEEEEGEFEWGQVQQGVILGSFFWGYLLFQVPGGRIAEVYGVKRVFGAAVAANGLLALLVPSAARAHWTLLLVIRALQGLMQGVIFPALSAAAALWVPIQERAKFLSFAACGASLGTVVSLPLCGWIIAAWGWASVFYVSGGLAAVWTLCWWALVFESPERHPRISPKEKLYLQQHLKRDTQRNPVPWREVLLSKQFWIGNIANFGSDWGFHTFITLGPKYMRESLQFNLEKSSWLTSLPFLCQYIFSNAYGVFADELLKRNVRLVLVRKISVVVSHLMPATCLVLLALGAWDVTMSIAILTLAVTCIGAFSSGYFQNPLDIAPNYAGSLTGIMNAIGSTTGIISTPIAGAVLHATNHVEGWQIIFLIAACMYTISSIPYLCFATAKIESWNSPKKQNVPLPAWGENHQPELENLTATKQG